MLRSSDRRGLEGLPRIKRVYPKDPENHIPFKCIIFAASAGLSIQEYKVLLTEKPLATFGATMQPAT